MLLITNAVLCPPLDLHHSQMILLTSPNRQNCSLLQFWKSFQLQLFTCSRIKSTCAPELPLPSPWSPWSPWSPCHHGHHVTMVTMSPCQAGLTQGLPKLRSFGLQELGIHLVESSPRSFEKNPLPMNLCKISRVPRRQLASISYKPARLPTSK